jgi:hypothetical protein
MYSFEHNLFLRTPFFDPWVARRVLRHTALGWQKRDSLCCHYHCYTMVRQATSERIFQQVGQQSYAAHSPHLSSINSNHPTQRCFFATLSHSSVVTLSNRISQLMDCDKPSWTASNPQRGRKAACDSAVHLRQAWKRHQDGQGHQLEGINMERKRCVLEV